MNKKTLIIIFILIVFSVSGCVRVEKGLTEGGVYKSYNQGETWSQKVKLLSLPGQERFLNNILTNVLVFDPQDSNTLYLGTEKNGLFVSYDGADSWLEIKRLPAEKINDVAIDPKAKHIVFVAIGNKIFKTTDANRTWSTIYLEGNSEVEIVDLKIDNNFSNLIFAGLSDGRFIKSENGGESWSIVKNFEEKVSQILIDPYNPQNIYLLIEQEGIYYSPDKGENWHHLEKNYRSLCRSREIQKIFFVPNLPNNIMIKTKSKIIKSRNGGENWSELDLLSSDKSKINSLVFDYQDPKTIYYTIEGTLYQTTNGGENWVTKTLPSKRIVKEILVDPINPNNIYLGLAEIEK